MLATLYQFVICHLNFTYGLCKFSKMELMVEAFWKNVKSRLRDSVTEILKCVHIYLVHSRTFMYT